MARPFRRGRHGITVRFEDLEVSLLARLFVDVQELLDSESRDDDADADPLADLVGISPNAHAPDDPALQRLLPPGTRDDEEAEQEFRRYTQKALRASKRAHLETARLSLGQHGRGGSPHQLALTDEQARSWLVALTDVRLVLGARLGLEDDESVETIMDEIGEAQEETQRAVAAGEEVEPDPRAFTLAVYDFLTYLQESLVAALLPTLPDH